MTDPAAPPRTDARWWLSTLFTGQGQVFFMGHPTTGLLMLVALAVADVWLAIHAMLGLAVGTVTAWLLRVDRAEVGAGLHGYCAALVGAAAYMSWGSGMASVVSAVLGAVIVVPLTVGLAKLLRTRPLAPLQLAVLTAPFCIVSGVNDVIARQTPHITQPLEPLQATGAIEFVEEVFEGVGQVQFADSYWAGAIIVVALAVASRRAAVAAVLGSATMTLLAPVLQVPVENIEHGLVQYSPVLVAIAVAAVFLPDLQPRWLPWVLAVVGFVLTLAVHRILLAIGVPVYTWPFILVTWVIVGTVNAARTTAEPAA